jgi:IS5 family transposase
MRFLGLDLGDKVPDAKTIWLFHEQLAQGRAVENLFASFDKQLARSGYLAMGGHIVDATIVAAPKQRNTDGEKADIKAGMVPQAWKDKPAKLAQKDRDARWTVKYSKAKQKPDGSKHAIDIAVPAFGFKNHVGIDRRHGLIRRWKTTDASRLMTGHNCPSSWTRPIPHPASGRIPPIDQKRTRPGSQRTGLSPTSIPGSPRVSA